MRIAHLIMVHGNRDQLETLVSRMFHPRCDIYIHVDRKADIEDFRGVISNTASLYFIKKRYKVNWGGFSFVKAITESIREILSQGLNYDYINLLSGQDYPIKPISQFYAFIEKQNGKSFISYDDFGKTEWWEHAVSRYERYHFTDINVKGRYKMQSLLNLCLPKRRFPLEVKLYGGSDSSWWTISSACAQYIVDFLDGNQKLMNFMKFTWGADEFLYTTIIMNSPFREITVNNNLRHIEWEEGQARPRILGKKSFEVLKNSESFFARKFDIHKDPDIILMLDEFISTSDFNFKNQPF